jgi:hypothetical protein
VLADSDVAPTLKRQLLSIDSFATKDALSRPGRAT